MTIFDVRIPGLKMTVVHADGQDVEPVDVDEFRMGAAETYDVIVRPEEDRAYTIFAESMDRSGFAAGTLAPREGMHGPLPERRKRPLRTMKDMGMAHAGGHGGGARGGSSQEAAGGHTGHSVPASSKIAREHAGHGAGGTQTSADAHGGHQVPAPAKPSSGHSSHDSPTPDRQPSAGNTEHAEHRAGNSPSAMPMVEPTQGASFRHGPDDHGPGNSMIAEMPQNRLGEPGTGLDDMPWRVLVYTDLRSAKPDPRYRLPQHEIELHLTGNMERNMWSINGKKFSEDPEPIPIRFDETTRFTLVNDTMMDHPMHIHGLFLIVENGFGDRRPHKHTVLVKAGERMSFDVLPDEAGPFAFHCHLLFHMEFGMFRVVRVVNAEAHS